MIEESLEVKPTIKIVGPSGIVDEVNPNLKIHPQKLTWNPKIGGLGRCFSFSKGPFSGSMLSFFSGSAGHFPLQNSPAHLGPGECATRIHDLQVRGPWRPSRGGSRLTGANKSR